MKEEKQQNMPQKENFQENFLFSWEIAERMQHERSVLWYITASIIGLTLIIFSIFTANFLLSIIVILVAFILIIREYLPTRQIKFAITPRGVQIDRKIYPFKDLASFYIIYEPPYLQKLYFEFKDWRPDLSVDIPQEIDPIELRDILLDLLPENLDKEDESGMDFLERYLKL